jgi:tRNA A-37 threonylcarbamoyl transferase component Bud32
VAEAALKHGYTNATATDGRSVVKRYRGPDGDVRLHNEVAALTAVAGQIPVPSLLAVGDGEVTLGFVPGRPGQELLEDKPEPVLYAAGRLARRLATVDPSLVAGLDAAPDGTVLVHGDFGPQNLLLDEDTAEPTALLDWEFAHIGDPIEDIAWAEWIVRTHHAHLVPALSALFAGYGSEPPWRVRQESMLAKCEWLLGFARRWPDPTQAGVDLWQRRLAATAAFTP